MKPPFSIRELASVALASGHADGWFLMLKAYFDDSGTDARSPITGMGGLVGNLEQWESFEAAWGAKLKNPVPDRPPLKAFHLSHCAAKEGEFSTYKQVECDLLTAELRRIIATSGLISTASVIDRKAWDNLVIGPFRDVLGSALQPCFVNCIDETIRIAKVHPDGRKIAIVFDRGVECDKFKAIADEYMRPLADPWIQTITFGRVENIYPLQGADMAATKSFWHAQKWLENGDTAQARIHFQEYLRTIRGEGLIIDREAILNELSRRDPLTGLVLEQPS